MKQITAESLLEGTPSIFLLWSAKRNDQSGSCHYTLRTALTKINREQTPLLKRQLLTQPWPLFYSKKPSSLGDWTIIGNTIGHPSPYQVFLLNQIERSCRQELELLLARCGRLLLRLGPLQDYLVKAKTSTNVSALVVRVWLWAPW